MSLGCIGALDSLLGVGGAVGAILGIAGDSVLRFSLRRLSAGRIGAGGADRGRP